MNISIWLINLTKDRPQGRMNAWRMNEKNTPDNNSGEKKEAEI